MRRTVLPVLLPALLLVACGADGESQNMTVYEIEVHKPIPNPQRQEVALLMAYSYADEDDYARPRNALAPGERLRLDFVTTHFAATEPLDLTEDASWTFSNPSVARIEEKKYLRGLAEGETTLCAVSGKYRACQAFVVRQAIYHYRSSSDVGSYYRDSLVAADGFGVVDDEYREVMELVEHKQAHNLSKVSEDGRWLFDFQNRNLHDMRTGTVLDAPLATQDQADWNYLPYYRLRAVGDDLVVLFGDYGYDVLQAGLCTPDGCPAELTTVFEIDPDDPSLFRHELAASGDWAAILQWGDGTARVLRLSLPDGEQTVLHEGILGGDSPYAYGPIVSSDGRRVAAGLIEIGGVKPASMAGATARFWALDADSAELLVDEPLALVTDPAFSPDSRFLYIEHAAGATVLDLDNGQRLDAAPGAAWTPWGNLHYFVNGDAWELVPDTGELLPSRYFLPFYQLGPADRQVNMTNLHAPVSVRPPQDEPMWDVEWLFAGDSGTFAAPPLEQASDPGPFVAFAMAVRYSGLPEDSSLDVRNLLQVRPLDGGTPTAILPGNQNVDAFDVARTGLIFIVTDPGGYLLVTDRLMRRSTILAIGVTGPVIAAADGSAVAARTPNGDFVAWNTATGEEILRSHDLLSLCLTGAEGSAFGVNLERQILELAPTGTVDVLSDNGLTPDDDGSWNIGHSWSDDCMTLLQVRMRGAARLHRLDTDDAFTIAGDVPGEIELGTVARDGSSYALTSSDTRWGSSVSGLIKEEVRVREVHVGRPPDWKPEKVTTFLGFEGNVRAGISYELGKPELFPGGREILLPYAIVTSEVGWGTGGAWGTFATYVHLLRMDIETTALENLQQINVTGSFATAGNGVVRLR